MLHRLRHSTAYTAIHSPAHSGKGTASPCVWCEMIHSKAATQLSTLWVHILMRTRGPLQGPAGTIPQGTPLIANALARCPPPPPTDHTYTQQEHWLVHCSSEGKMASKRDQPLRSAPSRQAAGPDSNTAFQILCYFSSVADMFPALYRECCFFPTFGVSKNSRLRPLEAVPIRSTQQRFDSMLRKKGPCRLTEGYG